MLWGVFMDNDEFDEFIKTLSKYVIKDINIRTQTLEELFLHYYGGEKSDK